MLGGLFQALAEWARCVVGVFNDVLTVEKADAQSRALVEVVHDFLAMAVVLFVEVAG